MLNKKDVHWYLLLILVVIIWGTMHPVLKVASGVVAQPLLNFLRFFITVLALTPFVYRKRGEIRSGDSVPIYLLGIVGIFLFALFNVWGIKLSTAANTAILSNTWPLMIAVLAPLFVGERVIAQSVTALIVGFFGVMIVLANGLEFGALFTSQYFVGNLLILVSSFCMALYNMFNKKYILRYGGLQVTYYGAIAGTLLFFLYALTTKDILSLGQIDANAWLAILWLAIPVTAFGWTVRFMAIDQIGLVKTGSFFLFVPIIGVFASNILLGEVITVAMILGALLVIAGVALVQRDV